MKKMSKLLMLVWLGLMPVLVSADSKTIISVSEEYEDATNTDGSGFYWEMIRAVYGPEGYTIQTDTMPYARAVRMVKTNKADLWCASYEEEEPVNYPKAAMDSDNVTAIFKKGKIDAASGTKGLDGKKVAWIIGYGYDEYISDAKMKGQEVKSRQIGFNLLDKDRIDAFMDAATEITDHIEKTKFDASGYELAPMLELKMYMAFRPDERGKMLAEMWDTRVKAMHESGELKKLYEKFQYTDYYPFK